MGKVIKAYISRNLFIRIRIKKQWQIQIVNYHFIVLIMRNNCFFNDLNLIGVDFNIIFIIF